MKQGIKFNKVWLTREGKFEDLSSFQSISFDKGSWYVLADSGAEIIPDLEDICLRQASLRPDIHIFYGDAVFRNASGQEDIGIVLKGGFDQTQLIAHDYIRWPLIVRGDCLTAYQQWEERGSNAFTYDLLLFALRDGYIIERITEVFAYYSDLELRPQRSNDHFHALQRWARTSAPECSIVDGSFPGSFRLVRQFDEFPQVTLVIPTRQAICEMGDEHLRGRPYILNMLESLCSSTWPLNRLSVIIGDDSDDQSLYESKAWPFEVRSVRTSQTSNAPFNYAAKMNQLWRMADSEYVVLMNDDLTVRTADWLQSLMTFAVDPEVGGVGARLIYPDGRLQHAGMAGGVMDACTHVFISQPSTSHTYGNWGEVHREWSMVTGAVFATRKSVLEYINGFDEGFALDFNDVDMCLRMRLLGLRIVYTPFAELVHYESASRSSLRTRAIEVANFLERWREFLSDDPYYHPDLVKDTPLTQPIPKIHGWWSELTSAT